MNSFAWFLLGIFAGAAPFYQIGYGRGMDWVWKNIVKKDSQ